MNEIIISKKTQYEFREYLVNWTLREIEGAFNTEDISCDLEYCPPTTGQRRSLVEQYYRTIDFNNSEDVKKVLRAYENVLNTDADRNPDGILKLCRWLQQDGLIYQNGHISSTAGTSLLSNAKAVSEEFDASHLAQQIKRMENSIETDPALAIGSAKELVETCCKTILAKRCKTIENSDLPKLVKETLKELKLLPDYIHESSKGSDTIKRILSNLSTITQGLGELRNLYGTGHGKEGQAKGLQPRHARLAVGAATTLIIFLFDTFREIEKAASTEI